MPFRPARALPVAMLAVPLLLGGFLLRGRDAAPDVPVVTFTAKEFGFEGPASIPAGPTRLELTNLGHEFHHLWIARLDEGKTADDVLAALQQRQPLPAWIHDVGGPNAPRPMGGTANATVDLRPGTYVVACLIPGPDGVPHVMKGMIRTLFVTPNARPATLPAADVAVTLHDYSFTFSRPLAAGRQVIEVRNDGSQWHEIELVRLAPGRSAHELIMQVEGKAQGAPAGEPIGGVAPLERGGVTRFDVDLAPGRYAFICFLPDTKDGKAHFDHGMVQEFDVPARAAAR